MSLRWSYAIFICRIPRVAISCAFLLRADRVVCVCVLALYDGSDGTGGEFEDDEDDEEVDAFCRFAGGAVTLIIELTFICV